jgi:thiamine-phosphate pyrophosphorylase
MLRYAVTDGISPQQRLLERARRWAAEGLDYVQLRERGRNPAEAVGLAKAMLHIFREYGSRTRLLVNARADVAVAAGADGVHLTAHPDELTPAQVRSLFALAGWPRPLLSISCHTLAEVEHACSAAVDLVLFGPVFEKRVRGELVSAGAGLESLRKACTAAASTQVLALGGVTAENAEDCLQAGAAGVAGIRLFTEPGA